MKKFTLLLLSAFFAVSLFAQNTLPQQPEDISPLLIGETIPNETVTSVEGQKLAFNSILNDKPTLLIFYRGGWCPYCNAHLAELDKIESQILELGYQIIAVSPDAPKNLQATVDKNELRYSLYSDSKGKLAGAVGVAFKAPERYEKRLVEYSEGENVSYLPVPSLFVLNGKGEIQFEYINPNYKQRISGDLLLAVLQHLDQ